MDLKEAVEVWRRYDRPGHMNDLFHSAQEYPLMREMPTFVEFNQYITLLASRPDPVRHRDVQKAQTLANRHYRALRELLETTSALYTGAKQ